MNPEYVPDVVTSAWMIQRQVFKTLWHQANYFRRSSVKVSIYYYMTAFIHHSVVLTYMSHKSHTCFVIGTVGSELKAWNDLHFWNYVHKQCNNI